MIRPRRPIDVHRHAQLVLEKERSETRAWKRQRLQAIRLAMEGQESYERIAEIVRCSAASLYKWLHWFREEGIDGLLGHANGASGGKEPRFSPQQWERFRAEVAKGEWRTARDAQLWLKEELGLEIALKEVYRHLGKLGARLKVGRRSHGKKDPDAEAAFRNGGLEEKLNALAIPAGRILRVWVTDEARFGLHTVHRRMWSLRGVRVAVPHQQKYEWDYTYAAVEVTRAGSVFCFQSTVNQESYEQFLAQISAYDPAAIHVVIQAGAGFHLPEDDGRVPANVRLITLPAYCPELNPIEKLWDHLKDVVCNKVYPSIEELRAALHRWLEAFWRDQTRAFSLIGRGWLWAQVNAGGRS